MSAGVNCSALAVAHAARDGGKKPLRWCGLLLCLLVGGVSAQETETVTVYGGTLAGIWKVQRPGWVNSDLFGNVGWGPLLEGFCRIEHGSDGYATYCFQQRGKGGALEVDGKHFHLAWGTMLARMVFDGELQSATGFTGHFAVKLAGIAVTDSDLSEGTKLDIRRDVADPGGKAPLLRAILNGETMPGAPALDANIAAAQALHLGAIETIAYIGPQGRDNGPKTAPDPDYLSVYAVEFENGERLCWLRQKPGGTLEVFQCA